MYHLEPVYEEAKKAYDEAIADLAVCEMIRIREKAGMDYNSAICRATEEGEKKGLKKAEKQIKKVEQEKAKAEQALAQEKAKALNVAKNMLTLGLTIEQVAQASGLPVEELKHL